MLSTFLGSTEHGVHTTHILAYAVCSDLFPKLQVAVARMSALACRQDPSVRRKRGRGEAGKDHPESSLITEYSVQRLERERGHSHFARAHGSLSWQGALHATGFFFFFFSLLRNLGTGVTRTTGNKARGPNSQPQLP